MYGLCYLLGLFQPTEKDCKTDAWQRVPTTQAGGGSGIPHIMEVLSLPAVSLPPSPNRERERERERKKKKKKERKKKI